MDITAGAMISPAASPSGYQAAGRGTGGGVEVPFKDIFEKAIQDANSLQQEAEEKAKGVATGSVGSFHEVIIAAEKASLALQLVAQMQNKLVDAYHEIMRLQL